MRDSLRIPASVAFYLLLGYAGLLLFSINYTAVVPGLDSSWMFALNYFAHGPELFGRDLIFTYGPLGFLAVPQNIGFNLVIAAAVHIGVWCLLVYLLLLLWKAGSKAGALFFLAGLICSSRLYFDHWDYLLNAMLLLALLLLLRKPERISILCIIAVIAGLSFLVKFTGFILSMLLAAIYSGSRLLKWKSTGRLERIFLVFVFAAGPLAYFVYNASVADLVRYMRSSWSSHPDTLRLCRFLLKRSCYGRLRYSLRFWPQA